MLANELPNSENYVMTSKYGISAKDDRHGISHISLKSVFEKRLMKLSGIYIRKYISKDCSMQMWGFFESCPQFFIIITIN